MLGVNRVSLMGILGMDPSSHHTFGGDQVVHLMVGTQRVREHKASGTQHVRTDWHRVIVWGALAALCMERLRRGGEVYVEGPLTNREWTDRQGQLRRTTEVRASHVVFVGRAGQPVTPHHITPADQARCDAFADVPPHRTPTDD